MNSSRFRFLLIIIFIQLLLLILYIQVRDYGWYSLIPDARRIYDVVIFFLIYRFIYNEKKY